MKKQERVCYRRQTGGVFIADFHLSATPITRNEGRSAVAASAYRSCSAMYNQYDGVQHDCTRKSGLAYQAVLLPPQAPAEWQDREQLWNAVELAEKNKDSRLAREFNGALPVELDKEQWIELLNDFVQKNFVDEGMCADVVIHTAKKHNPHFHLMVTVRPLDDNGKWQAKTQKEYLCIKDGEERGFTADEFKKVQSEGWEKQYQYKVGKKKVYMTPSVAKAQGLERASKYPKSTKFGRQNPIAERWNSEEQLIAWRKAWEVSVNHALEKANRPERVDCRSFKDRGIDEQPTIHEGTSARMVEEKGGFSERCELNRQIRADNRQLRKLKDEIQRLRDIIQSATSKLQAKLQERILSVSELASGLEQLRWGLIGMQYKVLFNEEHRSSQQERLIELENLKTAYKLNRLNGKNLYATKKRLERERNALSPLQIFHRQELTHQINDLTVKLQTYIEEKHDLLYQMGCNTEKDLSLVDKRIETLKEAIAQVQSVNAQFHNTIQNDCEQFRKEKATIPAELLGEVQQERRFLRQDYRYDLLHELQNDRKHYSYERYQQAEQFVDRALQDERIQPEKRPEVVEQERTHHIHRKHQHER